MEQQVTQRRFAVMGENLFRILNKLITNQRLCRLLKYQNENPFSKELPDVDGLELINNSICITPKIPEKDGKETAYVMVVFDRFIVNTNNPDFKISTVRFDIACPYNEWVVDSSNLRPYLIMQEIDTMFNQAKMSGIGNLQFVSSSALTLSPHLGGYSMLYSINDFN